MGYNVAYVDADSMLWRAGAVTEDEPASHCFQIMKGWLGEIPADCLDIWLSNPDKSVNYRYDIAKYQLYKGNRKQDKPKHYEAAKDYLRAYQGALVGS